MGNQPKMGNTYDPKYPTNYYKPTSNPDDWLKAITSNWKPPQTNAPTSGFNTNQAYSNVFGYSPTQNVYSGAESGAAGALQNMINTPYSAGQKSTIMKGIMDPVLEQAKLMKQSAGESLQSRGLYNSSVLDRTMGEIDKGTIQTMTGLAGQVERDMMNRQQAAISQAQAGSQALQSLGIDRAGIASSLENMRKETDALNTEISWRSEELNAKLGVRARELEMELAGLYQDQYKTETDIMLTEEQIMAKFEIDKATLDLAKEKIRLETEQENKNRTSNFFANLFGSAFDLGSSFIPV